MIIKFPSETLLKGFIKSLLNLSINKNLCSPFPTILLTLSGIQRDKEGLIHI